MPPRFAAHHKRRRDRVNAGGAVSGEGDLEINTESANVESMERNGAIFSGQVSIKRILTDIGRRLAAFLDLSPESSVDKPSTQDRRIADLRARLGAVEATRRRLERAAPAAGEALDGARAKAEFAIAAGREDLARAALADAAARDEALSAADAALALLAEEASILERDLRAAGAVSASNARGLAELEKMIDAARHGNEG